MTKIYLAGSIAIDRIMNFEGRFEDKIKPDKLHVISLSVLLKSLQDTHGGVGANIAYNLALLGEQPVLLGSVGPNAQQYMDKLAKLGVDVSHVYHSELPTASFTVMTDENDCQVGGFYPGAMADPGPAPFEQLIKSLHQPNDDVLIVVSAHDPALMKQQVQACDANRWRLFYDVSQQVSNVPTEDLKIGLEAAELLIVNDYEMGVIESRTGWTVEQIYQKVKVVIVTMGALGSNIYDSRQGEPVKKVVPAVSKVEMVDPTGAGDAYRAGFLYGYARDWELEKCAQLGSVIATFAIGKKGTQEHGLTPELVQQVFSSSYSGQLALS